MYCVPSQMLDFSHLTPSLTHSLPHHSDVFSAIIFLPIIIIILIFLWLVKIKSTNVSKFVFNHNRMGGGEGMYCVMRPKNYWNVLVFFLNNTALGKPQTSSILSDRPLFELRGNNLFGFFLTYKKSYFFLIGPALSPLF